MGKIYFDIFTLTYLILNFFLVITEFGWVATISIAIYLEILQVIQNSFLNIYISGKFSVKIALEENNSE